MRFVIVHEMKGRVHVRLLQKKITYEQADILQYTIEKWQGVRSVKVLERTGDVTVCYEGERDVLLQRLLQFSYEIVEVDDEILQNSGRALNAHYWNKLVTKTACRLTGKLFLPYPVRAAITSVKSIRYVWDGCKVLAKGKIEVPVLDGAAIGVSVLRRDFNTAASVMFLLGIGEILEEWTHKKSVGDLARSMSLNVGKVWQVVDGQEILVSADEVSEGDCVLVHMGNVIPFDGVVADGEGMVNQASMTGESLPVRKDKDAVVYAGTVLEEGELILQVKKTGGSSRYENIVQMIEESEKLKSNLEGRAEHLADRLVPYTLGGAALTWLLTRNATKALSVLMVDFSCALKLSMPIAVLSALREAGNHHVTVKGGRYLEAMSVADTIVFDKTGTLTKAKPVVRHVLSFNGEDADEWLRIAACMEEHFPHSMAKAVVDAAKAKKLEHEEMHSKVEYIVAHGISTKINGKKAVIGSYHFIFEDEKCTILPEMEEKFEHLPREYSHLYLAIENQLAAVICIEDPIRAEAEEVITALKKQGIGKVVMMTGDNAHTAKAIAARVGVDEYYAEVLPEEKAGFVEREKAQGRTVVMIGDGINDSPALSASDIGIAISDGAEIAKEIADVTVDGESLYEIVAFRQLSDALMHRIHRNYHQIVGFNTGLILAGVAGILPPTVSAMLHNTSTLLISLKNMEPLLEKSSVKNCK